MPTKRNHFFRFSVSAILVCATAFSCTAQAQNKAAAPQRQNQVTVTVANPAPSPQPQWLKDLTSNPELVAEIGKLTTRLQKDLNFPGPRAESHLLPLLPASTMFYLALPNYGDVVHQASGIFQEELQQNPALHTWWQRPDVAPFGAILQSSADKFYDLSQYLGDEIVVAAGEEDHRPKVIFLAQIRKPGFKEGLQQLLQAAHAKGSPNIVVLGPNDLATAQPPSTTNFLVLVRPDYVVGTLNMPALRTLNTSLDKHIGDFASSAFGKRVLSAYEGGTTNVGAFDVHAILGQIPIPKGNDEATFRRTGFADAQYWVWRRRSIGGQTISEADLSFLGPRHGIASWLAAPAPMGSLDFVSPKPILVGSIRLKNPSLIFDDINEIAGATNAKPFAGIEPFEQMFHISLKDDVLKRLTGELTLELDEFTPPQANWRAIFGTNDAKGLQQTVDALLAAVHFVPQTSEDAGTTYYTIRVPSAKTTVELTYAFQDSYWVVASSRQAAMDGIRFHRNGESLGKSSRLQASMPPGHASGVSALLFEDPVAVGALQIQQFAPELGGTVQQLKGTQKPAVVGVYADESSIHEESTSVGFDAAGVMVVAAVAIPNLLRSRMAANEASAIANIRTVNTAEVIYSNQYPSKGFAADLATLGSDPTSKNANSAEHAGVLDSILGGAGCKNGAWCSKSGFRFKLSAECEGKLCKEFVVVATPEGNNTGVRSFCSTADGIIRSKPAANSTLPASAKECRAWEPLAH